MLLLLLLLLILMQETQKLQKYCRIFI